MSLTIRLAARDWDYLTPIALGDVTSERLHISVDRVGTLVPNVAEDAGHDVAEASFSNYSLLRLDGRRDIVGVPHFVMRSFRNRCVITLEKSEMTEFSHLKGKRIGVTGWRDSGNTWTRALLRREGVEVEDAQWFAGRLTDKHPITDRLGRFARPGLIEACPDERPLMDLLREGFLDAVFTPFMPDGFFEPGSGLRQLQANYRAAEKAYYADVGYVPGIHILTAKATILHEHPWLAQELSDLIDQSRRMWIAKRRKYADTTPWMFEELAKTAADLPDNWTVSGLDPNKRMIEDFTKELWAQGITGRQLSVEELFPEAR